MPDDYGLPYSVWNREAVQALIKRLCHKTMPLSTVGLYLRRWGMTAQKPIQRAYERSPQAVDLWLERTYPAIVQQAKQDKGQIHWLDETGIRNECQHIRSYAPKHQTPVRLKPAKRIRMNMISTLTNQGKVRFMTYEDSLHADLFIRFLQHLIRDTDKKLLVIMDNLRVHHASKVKA